METPSKPSTSAISGSKKMKGLVAAAAMMAVGNGGKLPSPDTEHPSSAAAAASMPIPNSPTSTLDEKKHAKDVNAARARRLEQNRRAAIESRRRKKVMIAELQKSVAFYAKANESIKMDNLDLEQKLLLAKKRILQRKAGVDPAASLASERANAGSSLIESNPKGSDQPSIVATVHPQYTTGGPVRTDQIIAQLSATKALCEAMGYPPSGETSVAANPDRTGPRASPADLVYPSMDKKPIGFEEDIGSEEYVESLKKVCCLEAFVYENESVFIIVNFLTPCAVILSHTSAQFAMHQAAAASAAAAAANAAIQALNWHNIMKVQHSPSPVPASTTQEEGEFQFSPPAKKQKSL